MPRHATHFIYRFAFRFCDIYRGILLRRFPFRQLARATLISRIVRHFALFAGENVELVQVEIGDWQLR